jgi:Fe-S-cluster-containing dehydrogenase component
MSAATTLARFPAIVWRHPLLGDLDARARGELESAGSMRSVASGEKIFGVGDPADSLVVVVRGEIALRAAGHRAELRRARAGDAIGEECAARAHATRRHDAHAATDVDIALLPAPLLRRVIERADAGDALDRTRRWLARALADDALERSDFSRDLPRRARELLLDAGRAIDLARGDVLHREGDASTEAYFVGEGIVRLTSAGDKRVVAYHRAGDFFGDEALSGEPRDATAVAASDAWIFAVRKDVVAELAAEHPAALANALRVQTSGRAKQRDIRENATRHVLADLHRFETSRSLLAIDQERCIRCGHCAWSCAEAHEDGVSRLLRRGDVVVAKVRGEARTLLLPSSCQHCRNPACMIDCPTGAITRDARGEVHIREELCTGCGSCVKACPWDNIQLAKPNVRRLPIVRTESNAVAVKCDLCSERGEPACVAACPADAIMRVDPSVDFDEVADVLGAARASRSERTDRTATPRGTRAIVARAIVVASVPIAFAAFVAADAVTRRTSGFALLFLFAILVSYAIVKRFGVRARGALRRVARTRPHFIAHVSVGIVALGVGAAHARGHGALALAFFFTSGMGALAGVLGAFVPKRLARLERSALLPEEIAPRLAEIDARAFRDLSGTSDLLKGLYARVFSPYSRSLAVLAGACVVGRSQREMRRALTAKIHALVPADDERLVGLEGLVSVAVERQALRAQRVLGGALRMSSFAHVVVACGLGALVAIHVLTELLR